MALMVLDPCEAQRLKAERQANGLDRYDEVWEGVYMMAPLANNEHQDIQLELAFALRSAIGLPKVARVQAGANVSDREHGWKQNYRCPDVVVVYAGSAVRDCDTHWVGGPDFCIEIVSPGDRSRDKLDFYAAVGVRELLIVDRDPWSLELYRLKQGRLEPVGWSDPAANASLPSEVVPVQFRLVLGTPRPQIEVTYRDGVQRWLA